MEIIKEFCEKDGIVILRTGLYGSSIYFFNTLVNEAKEDFPDLIDEEIKVRQYYDELFKGTFGIEFVKSTLNVPNSYNRIGSRHNTF